MKNISKFQIIVLGIFAGCIVIALIIFSLGKTSSRAPAIDLLVWGTMPKSDFNALLTGSHLDKNETVRINYVEKNPKTYDLDFLEALVSGTAPDLFFLSSDSILKFEKRVSVIPYKNFSERDFKNYFIEGSEVFLTDEGILGLPVLVDPLVMYWNRDIFQSNGLVRPPLFWDEFYDLAPQLTVKEGGSIIKRSAVALGEYININNAFEILSTLIMQAGNPITRRVQDKVISVLADKQGLPVFPTESALDFYTQFSNPLRAFYSWNRALPWSQNDFIAGDLAVYFGLASELFDIRDKNPNLNFDVAMLPQADESLKKLTYGRVEALALNKKSSKLAGAFEVAQILSGRDATYGLSTAKSLPPVRRDLLGERPAEDYMEVFYDSAIIANQWLVPDRTKTEEIFRAMVDAVVSGRSRPREAVAKANADINTLLQEDK